MTPIWISRNASAALQEEADRAYPNETGGVLAGYRANNNEIVIFEVVGPGPNAVHGQHGFTPDHSWQCGQLQTLYGDTSGEWVYIGDWHTHPNGMPRMSWIDRRTLRRIAKHPHANTAQPMMLIGGGAPHRWQWMAHQYLGDKMFGLLIESRADKLHIFEQPTSLKSRRKSNAK